METVCQIMRECEGDDVGYELCRKLEQSRNENIPLSVVTPDGQTYSDLKIIPHLSVIKRNENNEPKKVVILTSSFPGGFLYFIWAAPGEKHEYRGPVDYYMDNPGIKLIPIKKLKMPP